MERTYACSEIRSHLPLFVGGELDPALQQAVERHLERCGACADDHAAALDARRALRGLAATTGTGPDLWPALRARLAAEGRFAPGSPVEPAPMSARRQFAWRALPFSAAAAVLLLAAGVMLGRMSQPGEADGGLEPVEPASGALVQQPGPAGRVRPVALQPLDPTEWPDAAPSAVSEDGGNPYASDGTAASFPVGPW